MQPAEATPEPAPIAIRPAEPSDTNFCLKSWLLTLRNASHQSWGVENGDFFEGEQVILKRLLATEACRVLVATPTDDPDLIAGFLVYQAPNIVHFVYVKAGLRRQGVARALFAAAGLDPSGDLIATTSTHDSRKGWLHEKYPHVRFNPYRRLMP